jgi:hypothetical protein
MAGALLSWGAGPGSQRGHGAVEVLDRRRSGRRGKESVLGHFDGSVQGKRWNLPRGTGRVLRIEGKLSGSRARTAGGPVAGSGPALGEEGVLFKHGASLQIAPGDSWPIVAAVMGG